MRCFSANVSTNLAILLEDYSIKYGHDPGRRMTSLLKAKAMNLAMQHGPVTDTDTKMIRYARRHDPV